MIASAKSVGVIVLLTVVLLTTSALAGRGGGEVPLVLVESSSAESLLIATPDGRGLRKLSDGSLESVSPDGHWVIVWAGNDRPSLVRTDGTRSVTLPADPTALSVSASWAPDSSRFAYVEDDVLRVVDLRWRTIMHLPGFLGDMPQWDSTGTMLAAASATTNPATKARALELVDVAAGTSRTVATDVGQFFDSLAWSPRGSTLAYETATGEIALLDVASGQRQSVSSSMPASRISWSPDGRMLAIEGLSGGADVVDAAGARLMTIPSGTNWRWAPDGRLTYIGVAGIVATDIQSGATSILAASHGKKIADFEWSPDGSELAFQRERFPGVGFEVFVRTAAGTEESATSPYPDGGDNRLLGWVAAPPPGPPPAPAHPRTVHPTPLARPAVVASLFQPGPLRVYASLAPELDSESAGIGCGRLTVSGVGSFDPCIGRGHALLEAAATNTQVAWVLEHEDEGIGDESGACAYVLPLGILSHPPVLDGCWADLYRKSRAFVLSASAGSIDVKAAGQRLLIGRHYDGSGLDDIAVWDGRTRRVIARAPSAVGLELLDADSRRMLVLRGHELRVLGVDGRALARRPLGPRFLGAALDGPSVVVLRTDAIEEYGATMKRVARMPIDHGLGGDPVLCGANGEVAAYLEGVVVHVVRFRDGRDVPLRIAGAAPPFTAGLAGDKLTVAYQREGSDPAGFVGTIPLRDVFG